MSIFVKENVELPADPKFPEDETVVAYAALDYIYNKEDTSYIPELNAAYDLQRKLCVLVQEPDMSFKKILTYLDKEDLNFILYSLEEHKNEIMCADDGYDISVAEQMIQDYLKVNNKK